MYKNLQTAMSQKGITRDSLAKLLGVHRNTIDNKLNGESNFTVEQAFLITEIVFPEFKISYLFHHDPRPKAS